MSDFRPEWFEKDYYAVLGVGASASQKEVTTAYRKLARKLHPDANPGDAAAEERFKEVSAAYEVIGDADKRKQYDQARKLGPVGAGGRGFRGRGAPGGGGMRVDPNDLGGIGDILSGMFGNRGGASGAKSRGTGPQRGADLEAELHLSFLEAAQGVETSVNLTSDVTCADCAGTGAAPGSKPSACPDCAGRGVVDDNQGYFSFSRPCARCGGRGRLVDHPCPQCSGSGVTVQPRQVRVRIPAGVRDRQRIRLKGRGAPGRHGGPAGDLFVVVHVSPDKVFGRDGPNLTITVPVTFAEVALGADIRVPTLDGEPVTLRVPAGTRNGRTFRVKGRGVGSAPSAGDLMVTVEVAVPAKLSAAERKAVEAFAAASDESPRAHLGV